jgi:EAL domain-containing protein (putative c-di-GMP-specific phosphodiesterase class I)
VTLPPATIFSATLVDQAGGGNPEFTFAFQPIVDAVARKTVSYEALVRGCANESPFMVFQQIETGRMHSFDASCRVAAVELACRLGISCDLNLNFLPQGLFLAERALLSTIEASNRNHFALDRITLEVTEGEVIEDQVHFAHLLDEYRGMGIKLSIDDFGAGHSGLNLLADFQPDQLKLDMKLVRNIASKGARQSIVRAIIGVCRDLGIDLIAEGIETVDEYAWFADHGVRLFQGYLFAKPGFECLPVPFYPDISGLSI